MFTITISNGEQSYEFETSRTEIANLRELLERAPAVVIDHSDNSDTHDFALRLYEALSAV